MMSFFSQQHIIFYCFPCMELVRALGFCIKQCFGLFWGFWLFLIDWSVLITPHLSSYVYIWKTYQNFSCVSIGTLTCDKLKCSASVNLLYVVISCFYLRKNKIYYFINIESTWMSTLFYSKTLKQNGKAITKAFTAKASLKCEMQRIFFRSSHFISSKMWQLQFLQNFHTLR